MPRSAVGNARGGMAPFSNVQASGPRLPSQIGAIIDYENTQSDIRKNEQDQAQHEQATFKNDWMKNNRDAAIQAAQELDPNADDYDEQVAGMHPFSFEVAGVSNLLTAKANIRNRNIGQQQKQAALQAKQRQTMMDYVKPKGSGELQMRMNAAVTSGDEVLVQSILKEYDQVNESNRLRDIKDKAVATAQSQQNIGDRADKRYEQQRARYEKTDIAGQIKDAEVKRIAAKNLNQKNRAWNKGEGKNKGPRPVDDEEQEYWEGRIKELKARQGHSGSSSPSKPTASPKKTTKNNIFNPSPD